MIILGIDPGTAATGYGVIEKTSQRLKVLDYGCIVTKPGLSTAERLGEINEELTELIKRYKPGAMAIEDIFFSKNLKTAVKVSQARGVMILAACKERVSVAEYTPLQVKLAITSYGRADKSQVQSMVKVLLGLKKVPEPDDAADALAVAICHANSCNMKHETHNKVS